MKQQRNLEEKFSTVLQVTDGKGQLVLVGWESDRQLARNFQQIVAPYQQPQEEFLARCFLKSSLNGSEIPFDREHLCAYLDESCFWIGKTLAKELAPLNLTPSECFSSARIFAADQKKIFKNYDFSKSKVEKYAFFKIKHAAKEHLHLGKEVYKYSPWGLLRHSSKKKFAQALQQHSHLSQTEIQSCLLALEGYKKIYTSCQDTGSQKLTEPTSEQWQDIVNFYNKFCWKKNLEPVEDDGKIKEWLNQCIQARIACEKLDFAPLDEDFTMEPLDEELYFPPQAEEMVAVNSVLTGAFLDLEFPERQLLKLWYGLGIAQGDIAEVLGIEKQYQVSRKVKSSSKKLLFAVAAWCREVQKRSLNDDAIKELNEPLNDWLKQYCQGGFKEFLQEVLMSDRSYDLPLLRLRYGEALTVKVVAEKLNISPEAVADQLELVREYLAGELRQFVADNLDLELPVSANKRLADFVKKWLVAAPYGAWY